jgi:tellurite resistance protein TehA-like permease
VTIVTWVVATLWIPPLIYATVRRFTGVAWATVFPLGMYASATYAIYLEIGWPWLTVVSLVFFWIALAAWAVVFLRFVEPRRR